VDAEALLRDGKFVAARDQLAGLVETESRHAAHWYHLSIAQLATDQTEPAATSVARALQLDARTALYHALQGLILLQKDAHRPALYAFRRAAWLDPDLPIAYFGQAMAHQKLDQKLLAERRFQLAAALAPAFHQLEKPPTGQAIYSLLTTKARPVKRPCACCAAYNEKGIHREDLVWRDMQKRANLQQRSRSNFKVPMSFRFEDQIIESGIGFENTIVDDGGRDYKAVHYDHGNGVAVADVDGDGRLDVYFSNQIGGNQLWRNLGKGRFEEITETAGVGLADRIGVTASFADYDNDGDPDLFVTTVRMGNTLFRNDGKGRFEDVTKAAGLTHSGHSSAAVFFDYNNDGLLDLLLTNVGVYTLDKQGPGGYYIGVGDAFAGHLKSERFERSILYKNVGGKHFVDQSENAMLLDESFSGDAAVADVNCDGFVDFYLLNMQGDDHFYVNQGGEFFQEETRTWFPKTPWGTMCGKFFDADNDGDLELYLTDMHSDMSQKVGTALEKDKSDMQWTEPFLKGGDNNIFGNAFYRRDGKRFEEVSDAMGVENYWPWGFSVGDLNADGYLDLFVASSMNFPFRYGINSVLINNRGERFLDSEFLLGVEPRPSSVKPWFVLDCSGADQQHRMCTDREGAQVVWAPYGSRSSVLFDYDDDGDLDILAAEFNSQPQLLSSNLAQRGTVNFLKVRLVGKKSNRGGLGAKVTVHFGERSLTQVNDGQSGYLSQSDMPLYFGLGEAQKVDLVDVVWPSGTKQEVREGLKANSLLVVREP
jgi:hypothetical protein